jgi:hypothetical protein
MLQSCLNFALIACLSSFDARSLAESEAKQLAPPNGSDIIAPFDRVVNARRNTGSYP